MKKKTLKTSPDLDMPEHFYKKWVGERDAVVRVKICERGDCGQKGEFRAPKRRGTEGDYYWFCLDHVREYNANWDYYRGLSPLEMEEAIRFAQSWERPSWPLGTLRKVDKAFKKAWQREAEPTASEEEKVQKAERFHEEAQARGVDPRYRAELNALRELGLAPPVDFEAIKKRYRTLVKRHHPDVSGGGNAAKDAEEKIKRLNSAFTLLKIFYAVEEG